MKPVASHYTQELRSLGDHIRKPRLDLGLFQKDVARQLDVTTLMVTNWEMNRTSPEFHVVSRLIEFLGYVPTAETIREESLGERIVRTRRVLGTPQGQLARRLGVDPT
jgi:ribosome-binding protein aMBF1 (putative translation factor)